MNTKTLQSIGLFMMFAAFVIALEQYVSWGQWFELDDIHHETFIIALAFAGFAVLVLANIKQKRKGRATS